MNNLENFISKRNTYPLFVYNGYEIKEIIIKKEVVDPEDVEMLQDLILTAVNEALKKADDMMNEDLSGFNIPGLM